MALAEHVSRVWVGFWGLGRTGDAVRKSSLPGHIMKTLACLKGLVFGEFPVRSWSMAVHAGVCVRH